MVTGYRVEPSKTRGIVSCVRTSDTACVRLLMVPGRKDKANVSDVSLVWICLAKLLRCGRRAQVALHAVVCLRGGDLKCWR